MHRDGALVQERLHRLLTTRLRPAVYGAAVPLEVTMWQTAGEPVPFEVAVAQPFSPVLAGDLWGPPWGTAWLRLRGDVPAQWSGRTVEALVELGFDDGGTGFQAEGLAYTPGGRALKGVNPTSHWVRVADPAVGGEQVDIVVEAAANPVILKRIGDHLDFRPTPLGSAATAGDRPQYRLGQCRLAVLQTQVWELVHDLEVLSQLAHELPATSARHWSVLRALDEAMDRIDVQDIAGTAGAARQVLVGALSSPADATAHRLSAVGHAHIDSGWLWPFRETRRKVARTVANVLDLMDGDDTLVYAMSSAQHFAWVQEDQPELFARLRERVAEGRIVPVGGMWVETDTMMPTGEAMVRQLLVGTAWIERELGVRSTVGWLPDSFGYSGALPQLLRQAGLRWFLTQKMSWNTTNRFPHHSFWWEGIDGSRIFTHFPSADLYNSELSGAEVAHAARNYADKGWSNASLIPFGHGDGGGGPTREMLARAHRLADLEGSPRLRIEAPEAFFEAAERDYPDAGTWLGEMYLEFHRGTLTSQARTKHGNRRSERLLHEAELWAATATTRAGAAYPYDALTALWKTLLLLQFHDVLPGSSIARVHEEAAAEHDRIAEEAQEVSSAALAALGYEVVGLEPGGDENPARTALLAGSSPFAVRGVPAYGIAPPDSDVAGVSVDRFEGDPARAVMLDNGHLRVTIAADGTIASLVDLGRGREIVPPAMRANVLQLHPDTPTAWDAWDIDESYRNVVSDLLDVDDLSVTVDAGGRAVVSVHRHVGESSLVQRISLAPGAHRLEMEVDVDWHEREKLLKVALPLHVSTDHWSAETQFGHVVRASHTNTSWDAARFEACAHRWVHVGEPSFGVAVVNESTYGHEVRRTPLPEGHGSATTVRLSLLRAPQFPDPAADTGRYLLRYAVVPGVDRAAAVGHAYDFTRPGRAVRPVGSNNQVTAGAAGSGAARLEPLVSLVTPDGAAPRSVVLETVKLAEDRSGDLVVRLYESAGDHATAALTCALPVSAVTEVDLLEQAPVSAAESLALGVPLSFRPFQVRTFRLALEPTA